MLITRYTIGQVVRNTPEYATAVVLSYRQGVFYPSYSSERTNNVYLRPTETAAAAAAAAAAAVIDQL